MPSSVRWVLFSALVLGSLFAFLVFGVGRREGVVRESSLGRVQGDVVRESSFAGVQEEAQVESAYEAGYESGYRAFMMQMGKKVAPVARYAVLKDSFSPEDGEEMDRGYVDGYHRAADSFVCPRFKDGQDR